MDSFQAHATICKLEPSSRPGHLSFYRVLSRFTEFYRVYFLFRIQDYDDMIKSALEDEAPAPGSLVAPTREELLARDGLLDDPILGNRFHRVPNYEEKVPSRYRVLERHQFCQTPILDDWVQSLWTALPGKENRQNWVEMVDMVEVETVEVEMVE